MSKEIYSIREEKRNGIPMNIVHALTEDTLHINPYFVHVMPMEQMNDIYDDEEEKVHAHSFYFLGWAQTAKGCLQVNNKAYTLRDNILVMLEPHQLHKHNFGAFSKGFAINLSKDYLLSLGSDIARTLQYKIFRQTPIIYIDTPETTHKIQTLMQMLAIEHAKEDAPQHRLAMQSLLTLLYTTILRSPEYASQCKEMNGLEQNPRHTEIYMRFLDLVNEHYAEWPHVKDYTAHLGYTQKTLTVCTMEGEGVTPLEIINQKRMTEIRWLLSTTHLSAKAIAHQMGFKDASILEKFFKRHQSMTIGEFRKEAQKK